MMITFLPVARIASRSGIASPSHRRRLLGSGRDEYRVELLAQLLHRHVPPHMRVGNERHALPAHLLQPPVDQMLLHLEMRNAVTQQAADAVRLLEHRHLVARARKLLRGGKPGRS
jgi:hypothetical protein